ncbi:chromate efflux transporter [Paenibacillus koleovorans]|uniref:chromate efflux transporter n=1 Tax=Paenibacillus koleovorans TaxID=121608 RepID=UPI000FDAC6D2|nr:chromate efflux transporter [Paenibacillus koleovorans]
MHKDITVRRLVEIWLVATKLGLTSFGGPIAHLGYFHEEYVRKRKWLDEQSYAELVTLCQFLPGAASSKVGIGVGVFRGGLLGGLAAWLGFTAPSVAVLVLAALLIRGADVGGAGWVHGLHLAAVAIVAHAVWGMGRKLAPDAQRVTIALLTAVLLLLVESAWTQVALLAAAGVIGYALYRRKAIADSPELPMPIGRLFATVCLVLFFALLVGLPLLSRVAPGEWLAVFDAFYRTGSLVFGGGHVVLPLLEREVVPNGWVDSGSFLAGYGLTQAMPGPLFTFAAYLGAVTGGIPYALLATAAVFLPSILLLYGVLPFWGVLRRSPKVQGALAGMNAAVVGLLLAALYDPLWTSGVRSPTDLALALVLFLMVAFWRLPPWLAVVAGAAGGMLLQAVAL